MAVVRWLAAVVLCVLPLTGGSASGATIGAGTIAYVGNYGDVDVVSPDGRTTYIDGDGDPSWSPQWSPDGQRLALAHDAGGRPEIDVFSPTGRALRQLTHTPLGFADSNPTWSPDGTRVAFSRSIPTKIVDGAVKENISELFVVRSDGSHLHRVTFDHAFDAEPAWSPRRGVIAFVRSGNIDELNLTDLVERPVVRDGDSPAWSPDGRRLAFVRDIPATITTPEVHAVFVEPFPANGGRLRRVTSLRWDVLGGISWSPDGKMLAIGAGDLSVPNKLTGIYELPADGSRQPTFRIEGVSPAWQP